MSSFLCLFWLNLQQGLRGRPYRKGEVLGSGNSQMYEKQESC